MSAAPRQDGGQGGGAEGVRGRDRRRGGASALLLGVRRLGPPGNPAAAPLPSAFLPRQLGPLRATWRRGRGRGRRRAGASASEAGAVAEGAALSPELGLPQAQASLGGRRRAERVGLRRRRRCGGWLGPEPVPVLLLI